MSDVINSKLKIPCELILTSVVQTFNFAKNFANVVKQGDFVALFGNLGAGKTVFVKGLCEGLGFLGDVTSPTFSIINEYRLKKGGLIVHCDMYRVTTEDDLVSVGFFDYVNKNNVVITEWSENIVNFLPDNFFKVSLNVVSECERLIKIVREV